MGKNDTVSRVAARILRGMAYNRNTFKDKVEEHVSGAWIEFYKASLAKKVGQTKWVNHWTTEVNTLLRQNLASVIIHDIRGFRDRKKALDEVFFSMRRKDQSYRHIAENIVKKDYNISKLKEHLTDQDTDAFWQLVEDSVRVALKVKT